MKAALFSVLVTFTSLLWAGGGLSTKYDKWLNEEVVYIISAEERSQFSKLSTDAEREAFTERFWKIRDTDPSTEQNEFKKEHLDRIKYATHICSASPALHP